MQNVPLDAVLHYDLHAAILGWLLTAVQPKLQHPRHSIKLLVEHWRMGKSLPFLAGFFIKLKPLFGNYTKAVFLLSYSINQ
jgi:hypothetical protein